MKNDDLPLIGNGEHITWSEEFSVGVESLDQQHKQLVALINKLVTHRKDTLHSEAVVSVFGGLINYVRQHFLLEEELMHQHGYPGVRDHVKKHTEFTEKLMQISADSENSSVEDLIDFLQTWFKHHMMHDDQDYSSFFAEVGAT